MKNTIEWHEQCLKNSKLNLKTKQIEADSIVRDLKKFEADTSFYEYQIEIAKTRKMDGFNRERFLKSRKMKHD